MVRPLLRGGERPMKRAYTVRDASGVVLLVLLTSLLGCAGGHGPTLPSPDGPGAQCTAQGQVTDGEGGPVAGALVRAVVYPGLNAAAVRTAGAAANLPRFDLTTETDSDGNFCLESDGVIALLGVTHADYLTRIAVPEGEKAPIALEPRTGDDPAGCPELEITQAPGPAQNGANGISGFVKQSDCRGIGVARTIGGVGDIDVPDQVCVENADADGEPLIGDRPFTVSCVSTDGPAVIDLFAASSSCPDGFTHERVVIEGDGEPQPGPHLTARGTVVDGAGNPIPNATVRAIHYPEVTQGPGFPSFDVQVQTNEDGEFEIGFDDGNISLLSITHDGKKTRISGDITDQDATIVLEDRVGPAPTECAVIDTSDDPPVNQAAGTARIEGMVTGCDSDMIGIAVNGVGSLADLVQDNGPGTCSFDTDVDLQIGTNEVDIFASNDACGVTHRRVTVQYQQAQPDCEIAGTVVDENGDPVANATVRAIAEPTDVVGPAFPSWDRTVQTDENGEFCIEAQENLVTRLVSVTHEGHESRVTEDIRGDDVVIQLDPLDGPAPTGCPVASLDDPQIDQQNATATITGSVTGCDSREIGVRANEDWYTFIVDPPPGGRLTDRREFELETPLSDGANTVDVFLVSRSCNGVTAPSAEISFTPGPPGPCELAGVVRNQHGDPLPAVTVGRVGTDFVTASDADGRFCLDQLPPGRHLISLQLEGHTALLEPVYVGGHEEEINFVMLEVPDLPTGVPEVVLDPPVVDDTNHTAQITGTASNVGSQFVGWIHNGVAFSEAIAIQPPLTAPQPIELTIDLVDGQNDLQFFGINSNAIGASDPINVPHDYGPVDLYGEVTDGVIPLPARVHAFDGQSRYDTTTNAMGAYFFATGELPDTRFGIGYVSPNWESEYEQVDLSSGAPATLDVELPHFIENLGLPCATVTVTGAQQSNGQGTIEGTVTNSDGREIMFLQDRVPKVGQIDGAPVPG
ncbi:MAG: hypothetical protein GF393_11545, partial [Armatimonadia bacterium]|nr:hypothetical protein [Armatimonadia bacterium]